MKFFLGDATKGSVEGYKNLNFFTILEKGIFLFQIHLMCCGIFWKKPCYVISNISYKIEKQAYQLAAKG
jgi:hypothetical protein